MFRILVKCICLASNSQVENEAHGGRLLVLEEAMRVADRREHEAAAGVDPPKTTQSVVLRRDSSAAGAGRYLPVLQALRPHLRICSVRLIK